MVLNLGDMDAWNVDILIMTQPKGSFIASSAGYAVREAEIISGTVNHAWHASL